MKKMLIVILIISALSTNLSKSNVYIVDQLDPVIHGIENTYC